MCAHFRRLLDDPWLIGCPFLLSKAEKRAQRIFVPIERVGWRVYNSDGACRRSQNEDRSASCGAVLRIDGVVCGEIAIRLGDMSNNAAEYEGVRVVLRHANASLSARPICIRVDSLLVARQIQGVWRCKHYSLHACFEECIALYRVLQERLGLEHVCIEHVYREYNASADALANEALDNGPSAFSASSIIVDRGWSAHPYA